MISLGFRMNAGTGEKSAPTGGLFTALVQPVLLTVTESSTLAQTLAASAGDKTNYSSSRGKIVSATPEWSVDGGGWTLDGTKTLAAGQKVEGRVTVTDATGARQVFAAGTGIVLPRAPQLVKPLADVLAEVGVALAGIDTAAAFSGSGLGFALAPDSGDLAAMGLRLDAATGRITGTPTALKAATRIAVRASNAGGQATASFSLTIGARPAQMAAPTLVVEGATAIGVTLAAAPVSSNAPILRHDLRHSTNGTSWTEVAGVGPQTSLKDLTPNLACQVQTRAVNALGAGAWSASASATPVAPAVPTEIRAVVAPAMGLLCEGQAVQDSAGYATMTAAANFTASGSTVAGVTVGFLGDAVSASGALLEGNRAGFEVAVTAANGARKLFPTDLATVEYAVEVETDGDNTLTIDINDHVAPAESLPVTVTEEPWASRGVWPVGVSRTLMAAGPVNLVTPRLVGTPAVGETLAVEGGLWGYDESAGVPEVSTRIERNGAAVTGATGASYVVTAADAGATLSVVETAAAGGSGRSAASAGLAIPKAGSNAFVERVIADGPTDFWRFTDGGVENVVGTKEMTLYNLTFDASAPSGRAAVGNGLASPAGGHATVLDPKGSLGTGAFSVSLLFFAAAKGTTDANIVGKTTPDGGTTLAHWVLRFSGATGMTMSVRKNGVTAAAAATLGTWSLIHLVGNGTDLAFYQDGVLMATASSAAGVTGQPFTLFGPNGTAAADRFFAGKLAEVAHYGRALTPAEIAAQVTAFGGLQ